MSKPCLPLLTPTDTHTQSASSSTRGIYPLAHRQERASYGPEIGEVGSSPCRDQAARVSQHLPLVGNGEVGEGEEPKPQTATD